MAAPATKNVAPRASSILSQENTASTQGGKPVPPGAPLSVTTKAWVTLKRVFFTASDVGAADKLFDILSKMQEATLSVLGVVSTNQLIPGNILRGVTFTPSQTLLLAHGLGREWQGYFCVRTSAGGPVLLSDGVYPAGVGADSVVPLKCINSGTYDIYVF